MGSIGMIPLLLIIANCLLSYRALKNRSVFEQYVFEVDKILLFKEYRRVITSGFIHVNWMHLIFNMLSLYIFSGLLVHFVGEFKFLLIYAASLIGGGLFSLFIHRNDAGYRAVGASGAVNGIMFSSIALFPDMGIGFFFLPISIPSWVYGFLYIVYCIYGIRSRNGGVGHDAHFGGAIIGLLFTLMMYPAAITENYLPILFILIPSVVFIYLLVKKPHILYTNSWSGKKSNHYSIDHKYNAVKRDRQMELDRLLDKIHRTGIESLSKKEKELLKEYAEKK